MALFQRNTQTNTITQYYTIGQHKTILIVGLGNIGKKYANTRHNVGFLCAEAFVRSREEMSEWHKQQDLKCELSAGQLGETRVIVIKPTTFMNLSGEAVLLASHFYKVDHSHIVVIHDEIDIPFGQIRMRTGGGSAGHNGIKSITNVIGEPYNRIRIGIGPKEPEVMDTADFVLQRFTASQNVQLPQLAKEVSSIISEYIYGGQMLNETRSFII